MHSTLWTDQPLLIDYDLVSRPRDEEEFWEKSVYPIGNGRLGCTAFGEPKRERIQFNQESLWVGNEDNTGGYQPFGDVYIEFDAGSREPGAASSEPTPDYSNYRRELDLARAIQTITYKSGGVTYRREYFASYPAQVIVLRFTADRPGSLSGEVSMGNVHDIPVTTADQTLVMQGDTSNFWWWQVHLEQPKRLIADRQYASPKNIDLDFEARVRVLHDGGTIGEKADSIVFAECDSLTLLLAADTNYVADRSRGWRREHPHRRVCDRIAEAEKLSYAELLEGHTNDYQSIFGRLKIELGETSDEISAQPTAERVKAYGEKLANGQQPDDRALEVLLYQYARYLMISCSRQGHGSLPANLQGLWLINKRPSWRCDFHTDINIQMNYWFTSASNLAECFEPLPRWIDSIREVRKQETRLVLGVERGWLMRSENGIFGGSTWHFQKGDSAWLCQNLWDHYTFTQDEGYLERYAYPVMKEISEFWLDHLKELPDGTLVAPGGRSPEHGPVGVDGVTYDQALCWDLFTNTIEAAQVLGLDPDLQAELKQKRDRLLPPQIGRWGQFQEWMEDIDDPEDDHRHINHLIGLYPGRQIHPATTPELAKAAKVSVMARRDHGRHHPAWSRVWKAAMFARLFDGEAAYGELVKTLATHIYDNLWAVHPPFQIDANFGYAAAVNEMLVQSRLTAGKLPVSDDPSPGENGQVVQSQRDRGIASNPSAAQGFYVIHLLPALPAAWANGRATGLRVRGGFEVDMEWRDGRVTHAAIRGVTNRSETCLVQYGEQRHQLEVKSGAQVTLI